jgi:hypothetical protein
MIDTACIACVQCEWGWYVCKLSSLHTWSGFVDSKLVVHGGQRLMSMDVSHLRHCLSNLFRNLGPQNKSDWICSESLTSKSLQNFLWACQQHEVCHFCLWYYILCQTDQLNMLIYLKELASMWAKQRDIQCSPLYIADSPGMGCI